MNAVTKDLQYYLSHPDEMPDDPAELERLANEHREVAMESGAEQLSIDRFVEKDEKAESSTATGDTQKEAAKPVEAAPETPKASEEKAEIKPDGILAKDGKNLIPYSQLESARSRAATAEERAKAAEDLAARQAQELEALKNKPNAAETEMLTEDELAALEADSPTLAKTLRMQQALIQQLRDEVGQVKTVQQHRAVTEEASIKSEIQSAIDANPTLAGWQTAEDQTMWNEASRVDRMLRESPAYASVSFEDRFKKVVEMTQVALNIEPPKSDESPALTPEQIRAAAAAKLKQVTATKRPTTLSDIPGGAPPAVDERQKVEEMSPIALGQQFLGMTKEQLDAYLASL